MEEIAAILGADGSSTTLTEPGTLVVFRREKGAWTNNRTMPLALDQTEGLREMRNKMAGLLAFLGDCRIVVTKSQAGPCTLNWRKPGARSGKSPGSPMSSSTRSGPMKKRSGRQNALPLPPRSRCQKANTREFLYLDKGGPGKTPGYLQ